MKNVLGKALYVIVIMFPVITGACHKDKKGVEPGQAAEVEVAKPVIESVVTHKTFPGVVASNGSVDVVARVNGTLLQQCFKDGDYVEKGQVLYRIESTQYANAVKEAEASLATARSQAEYYRNQHAAMQKALESDAVSKMNVLEAESNLRQAEASIKNALAALSDARTQLEYCIVKAPISGTVSASSVDVGTYIGGAATPSVLCKIVDNSNLKVVFSIDDSQYQTLMTSSAASSGKGALFSDVPIVVSDLPDASLRADLYYVSPTVDTSTGTISLEGKISDPSHLLRDGMYVTVDLPTGVVPHALLVRDASIGTDQLGKYLYVVNDSDKVVYTPVKVGALYQDTLRVVTDGIDDDSRYVTKALLTVRNGMKVKPVLNK